MGKRKEQEQYELYWWKTNLRFVLRDAIEYSSLTRYQLLRRLKINGAKLEDILKNRDPSGLTVDEIIIYLTRLDIETSMDMRFREGKPVRLRCIEFVVKIRD